jgi:hypothetical protein
MRKAFAEIPDVRRERGFIPVGRMRGFSLEALELSRTLADLKRCLSPG